MCAYLRELHGGVDSSPNVFYSRYRDDIAMDKIKALIRDAVYPAQIPPVLARCAIWWHHTGGLAPKTNIKRWVEAAEKVFDQVCVSIVRAMRNMDEPSI
jgi:hypothetical protein